VSITSSASKTGAAIWDEIDADDSRDLDCRQAMAAKQRTKRKKPVTPKQTRAVETRERLLDVAGELLREVGIEGMSTNLICARAGTTPPALYRYFRNKHAVLETLGQRLMDRQNVVLLSWLERHATKGVEALNAHLEDLQRETARVTAEVPGGAWIERALRASPGLAHVRVESHRYVTDRIVDVYAPLVPHVAKDLLWRRIRLAVEFGYAMDEMLNEEDRIPRDDIFQEAARFLRLAFADLGS
jgi:AcrR family transcriptional regulator